MTSKFFCMESNLQQTLAGRCFDGGSYLLLSPGVEKAAAARRSGGGAGGGAGGTVLATAGPDPPGGAGSWGIRPPCAGCCWCRGIVPRRWSASRRRRWSPMACPPGTVSPCPAWRNRSSASSGSCPGRAAAWWSPRNFPCRNFRLLGGAAAAAGPAAVAAATDKCPLCVVG